MSELDRSTKTMIIGSLIVFSGFIYAMSNMTTTSQRHVESQQVKEVKVVVKQSAEEKRKELIEDQKKNRKRGLIRIGDYAEAVLYHWGNPSDFNQSIYSWGVHEQWIYKRGASSVQYVYLENGIVTAIQTF